MKKLLFVFALLYYHITYAQDTIIKNNGEQILSRITEISSTEIKYKKFNFQEGPTYIEKKADVRSINYSTGVKQEFKTEFPPVKKQIDTLKIAGTLNDDDYYGHPERGHLSISKKIFMRDDTEITEEEFYDWLTYSKNAEIIDLARKSKLAKIYKKINLGFMAGGFILIGSPPLFILSESLFVYCYFKSSKTYKISIKKAVELYNKTP
jgi:hypothetical protein